jgi:uncharacterized protein YjbJ (UPF0337 family)
MSDFKDFQKKAEQVIGEHDDQIESALEKVADFVDDKTGGKFSDKIEEAKDKAQGLVDKIGDTKPEENDRATP